MKRLWKAIGLSCVLLALVLSACTNVPAEKDVVVTATQDSVQLKDTEVSNYDFTSLFSVTDGGLSLKVEPSYLDVSQVKETPGTYPVTCTYKNKSATVSVTVVYADYALELSAEEITLKAAEVATYNFKSLFKAWIDDMRVNIEDEMVTSTVKAEAGDYTYTVTIGDKSETLTVHVVPDHEVEIVLSYPLYELPVNEKDGFDPASLFSVYVDGAAEQVDPAGIDASALAAAKAGDDIEIGYTHSFEGFTAQKNAPVKVVAAREIAITARNVETYPNGAEIDLTSLFTITYGGKNVPVTIDMIEGSIDYSAEGENEIVLTYGGKTATATVTVRRGVILGYAKGDHVTVRVGTDARTYPFAEDFDILINGMRYRSIPDSYFDLSEVDFGHEGEFDVTLTIPYGDQKGGWSGYPVTNYPLTITYVVTPADYTLSLRQEVVELPVGTTSYDPFKNLSLVINGIRTDFTDRKDYVDITCVYAEVKTEIDFSSFEDQTVTIDVYVFGPEEDPVEISFTVRIKSEIKVEAVDRIAFTGSTLYTRDLFSITENGEEIEVTNDMISGKVDTFTPGIYEVTIAYRGLTATSRVVVYSGKLAGTYKTLLRTIPEPEEEEDDEGWGDSGWDYSEGGDDYDYYAARANSGIATIAETLPLGDLVITENGGITFNGITAYSVTGIDEHTMTITTGSGGSGRVYKLHYEDGIVVLDVENNIRMGFSDYARPLVYFSEDLWTLNETVVINYGSQHVLETENSGNYSLNAFRITSKTDGTERWYGLYIKLVLHTSGDTIYDVQWGDVSFDSSFSHTVGSVSSLDFNGKTYAFTMEGYSTGKINRDSDVSPYAGKTFTGTIDGSEGKIVVSSTGQYTVYKNNVLVCRLNSNDLSSLKNGGVLPQDVLFFYASSEDGADIPAPFSYRFALDVGANTFTTIEKDAYFGRYCRDDMKFFLDGYGTGMFTSQKVSAAFSYSVRSGEVEVTFEEADPSFAYGKKATFYIASLLNVLTPKSSEGNSLAGEPFTNDIITDGAVVTVSTTTVYGTGSEVKTQLLAGITIVTKDGPVASSDKEKYVDTSAINSSKAGFYQFLVTVKVGGKDVVSYYSVQVVAKVYEGNPVVGAYPTGLLSKTVSLTIDATGRVFITASNSTYTGFATIYEDNTFSVKAYGQDGTLLTATGVMLAPGVLEVRFGGAFGSADYFTRGTYSIASGADGVLYRFGSESGYVYVYASATGVLGVSVTVTNVGNTYTITFPDGSERTALVNWNSSGSGFTFTS